MKHDDFSGILQRVRAFCEAEALLTPLAAGKPLHLAAAVSGGAVSMALLHLLLALQAESGFVLSVCQVNHGLRGETAAANRSGTPGVSSPSRRQYPRTCARISSFVISV